MAAIIQGQVRAHPPGSTSRGVSRDRSGPPPQLWFLSARGRWLSILVLAPRSERVRGRVGGLGSPLEDHLPPSTRQAQVRFPAQATGAATLGEVEADSTGRDRERGSGAARSLAGSRPRAGPGAAARGLRAMRLRKPGEADRSALAANSSAVRPPSWACSVRPPRRRPPTRKLALPGRGGENAAGGEPASPAAPRRWQTSRRPRSSPGRDRFLTNKIRPDTPPPIPPRIMEAAVAGLPLPPAPAH